MNINRFSTQSGYGALKAGFALDFEPNQLNLILGPNEAGKSTLIHGILCALFDLSSTPATVMNRFGLLKTQKDLLERFKPWLSSTVLPLRVELEIEHQSQLYEIKRELEAKQTTVVNLSTGNIESKRFEKAKGKYSVGEELLGINEIAFLNTAFICQNHLQAFEKADEVTALLAEIQKTVEMNPHDSTATQAISLIEKTLQEHKITGESRRDNRLAELENKRADLEAQIEALEVLHQLALSEFEQNQHLHRQDQQLQEMIGTLEALCLQAEYQEIVHAAEQASQLECTIEDCEQKLKLIQPLLDSFPIAHKETFLTQLTRYEEKWSQLQLLEQEQQQVEKHQMDLSQKLQSQWQITLPTEPVTSAKEWVQKALYEVDAYQAITEELKAYEQAWRGQAFDYETYQMLKARYITLSLVDRLFLMDYAAAQADLEQAMAISNQAELSQREAVQQKTQTIIYQTRLIVLFFLTGLVFLGFYTLQHHLVTVVLGGLLLLTSLGLWGLQRQRVQNKARLQETLLGLEQEYASLQEADSQQASRYHTLLERLGRDARDLSPELISEELQQLDRLDPAMVQQMDGLLQQQRVRQTHLEQYLVQLEAGGIQGLSLNTELPEQLQQLVQAIELSERLRLLTEKQRTLEVEILPVQETLTNISAQMGFVFEPQAVNALQEQFIQKAKAYDEGAQLQLTYEALLVQRVSVHPDTLTRQQTLETQLQSKNLSTTTIPEQPSRTYLTQLGEQRKALDELRKQLNVSELQVSQDREKVYQEKPRLQQALIDVKDELKQLKQFQKALFYAKEGLEKLAADSHQSWSASLNQRAGHILKQINPRYNRLVFNDQLMFLLEDSETGKTLSMEQVLRFLSAGAKDQLYFAIRLAILEQLAQQPTGAVSIPLILDDPFVNCDDQRFREGMNYLLARGLETSGQTFLLSCHAERYQQWFAGLNPNQQKTVNLLYLKDVKSQLDLDNKNLEASILSV